MLRGVTRIFTRGLHIVRDVPRGSRPHVFLKIAGVGAVAAVGCCSCVYYRTLAACAKEGPTDSPRFVLYQYSNCPFCSKVRAYLHSSGEDFKIVEVNPLTKAETKAVTDYKKVPMLVADGIVLKESSVITTILHTHLTTGRPISELVELYPAVAQYPNKYKVQEALILIEKGTVVRGFLNEFYYKMEGVYKPLVAKFSRDKVKYTYPNKYKIMGFTEGEQKAMERVGRTRKWVDEHFVHLISPNVYRTWKEALASFDYFTVNGNFDESQKFYIRYIGAAAMYLIGKRLKRRHIGDNDVREELYDGMTHWTKVLLKDQMFHGGSEPDLADVDMWGMCSAFHGMPAWHDACKHTKIEPWYNRMEKHLNEKSAIGIQSANPTHDVVKEEFVPAAVSN